MINADRVNDVFRDCLFNKGEDTTGYKVADGITSKVGFHPERIEDHRIEIEKMLEQLPDEFQASMGGGHSFLNACNDKNGNQWTRLHQRMEQLFQLGIGIDKVKCLMTREMWSILPGGMPYYVVLDE